MLGVIAAGAALSGCAYSSYEAHPKINRPVSVGIGSAQLSKFTDLRPIDHYFVKDGFVVAADSQISWTTIVLTETKNTSIDLRGLLHSSRWPGLASLLSNTIKERLGASQVIEISGFTAQSPTMRLTPFACVKVNRDRSLTVYAMIQADASDQADSVKQSMRYYARVPERLVGSGFSGDGEGVDVFARGMSIALDEAFQVFIDDIEGRLSTLRTARISVNLPRASIGLPTTFEAAVVRESPTGLVFSLSAPTNPDHGLILVHRGEYEIAQESKFLLQQASPERPP